MNKWAQFNMAGLFGLIFLLLLVGSAVWCMSCTPKYVRRPYKCVEENREKKVFKVLVKNVTRETTGLLFISLYNGGETVVHKCFITCSSQVFSKGDNGELHITRPYARFKGWSE